MEKIERIKYFSDHKQIIASNADDIAELLGKDIYELNFENPKYLAMVFELLYQSQLPHQFIENRREILQQGLKDGFIKLFSKRKEYSKQDFLNSISTSANSLFDRFQLSNHTPNDYILLEEPTKDRWNYLIPNFNEKYRYFIAKALNPELCDSSPLEILQRLCVHYEKMVLPLLRRAEPLYETTDLLHTTSRIVRLPDEQDQTIGWLLSTPLPQESKIKGHAYNTGGIKIYYYRSKEDVLSQLNRQQKFTLKQQVRVKDALLQCDKSKNYRDDLFHNNTEEFYKKLSGLVDILSGQSDTEKNIRKSLEKVFPNKTSYILNMSQIRKKLEAIIVDLKEKEISVEQVLQKNKLHIKSLSKYDM